MTRRSSDALQPHSTLLNQDEDVTKMLAKRGRGSRGLGTKELKLLKVSVDFKSPRPGYHSLVSDVKIEIPRARNRDSLGVEGIEVSDLGLE